MSNFNKSSLNKKYYKSNYDEVLRYLIPDLYFEEDLKNGVKELDILDKVINSNLKIIANISQLIDISPVVGSVFSNINTPEGISQFFIKQNLLTQIDANDFERKILIPLNKDLRDFNTKEEFLEFLEFTLLPGIRLNTPSLDFTGGDQASNHVYLINNLSWLYFLNIQDNSLTYSPCDFVLNLIADRIYVSREIKLNDCIRGLITFLWKNFNDNPSWKDLGIIPIEFVPPTSPTEHTDGEKQLDKLLTLIDVIYSPSYLDSFDFRVKDAIDDYINNKLFIEKKITTGPFLKLVKSLSYSFADYSNTVDLLETLTDINNCPSELLPYVADLLGWKLFGSEPDRWRLQISNAVKVYKAMGTKRALQFAVDSVFGQEVFDVSSAISEMWESYIPNLIYYSLATESTLFKNYDTWTLDQALKLNITPYDPTNFDTNIRLATDYVLYQIVSSFPDNFYFNGSAFNLNSEDFVFNYRGRDYPIPPFEEYLYYTNVRISSFMVDVIVDKLVCLSVNQQFASSVGQYIKQELLNIDREDVRLNEGLLFFTSSLNYPPNFDTVISDVNNYKPEYLSLWNGKSSNFIVTFDTSSFDFAKDSLEADSKEALMIASQVAQEFSPAHSIPNVLASAKVTDLYDLTEDMPTYVFLDNRDYAGLQASSTMLARFAVSASYTPSYKRGLTPTSVDTFGRRDADSLLDTRLYTDSSIFEPRNAHRRRDFNFILPKDGFYDKTGFNSPISLQPYIASDNYYALGFIPSSLSYQTISDYNNIPPVYDKCENLQSLNSYYGVTVSSTYPIRGWKPSINN